MQCGETEIGQGADTAYAQMTAEAVGLKSYRDVRVVSCQDTDITPTGLGAYASRQTYVVGFSIRQTATLLRQKILAYATKLTRQAVDNMDIVDGNVVRKQDGAVLMSLSELAMTAQYNAADSEHITAESTYTIRNNAYSFGCTLRRCGGRHRPVQGQAEQDHQRSRLRQSYQSRPGGGPGPRRYVHGHRLRYERAAAVR